MLDVLKMRVGQIAYSVKSNGWNSLRKEVFFVRRTAIILEKDLSEVVDRPGPLASSQLKLLELDKNLISSGAYCFAVPHRRLKAVRYLKHGYGGFAIARDNLIVGDFWYYSSETTGDPSVLHVDLRRFGFQTWQADHVYTFDIFVAPTERKHGVSAAFQNNAAVLLASKGYTKAYGYYFSDNMPAIWCTRVTNRWKELRAASISRFLLYTRVIPL